MSRPSDSDNQRFASLPYVWAAIITASVGGFGLGALLLLGAALGLPVQAWWLAGVQAHGHAQLVGWGGLMVLGVGLHFLPRLRGVALARPTWRPWALRLLASGLLLRILGQPGAALLASDHPLYAPLVWLGLGLSGLLELGGALATFVMMAEAHRRGPPPDERPAFRQIQPLLTGAFLALLLGLALNALLGLEAALARRPVLTAHDLIVVDVLLVGFLVPISVAVSARFFPLYLGLRPASARGLRVTLGLLLAGVGGRVLAMSMPAVQAVADGLVALGLLGAIWSLFQRHPGLPGAPLPQPAPPYEWAPTGLVRRQPPSAGQARRPAPAASAARLLLRSAYWWLLVGAVLALWRALAGVGGWSPPPDAERHALGVGFVTLLIMGMGTLLLPGFLGGAAPAWPVALTVGLGNLAAALRVGPVLLGWLAPGWLPGTLPHLMAGVAGLLGLVIIGLFAVVVAQAGRGRRVAGPGASKKLG